MKAEDLRKQSPSELEATIADLRRQAWRARYTNHVGRLDNTASIRDLRTSVARALTVLNEKSRLTSQGKAGDKAAS